jgi:Kef-type K+ transport system membrane component KefB
MTSVSEEDVPARADTTHARISMNPSPSNSQYLRPPAGVLRPAVTLALLFGLMGLISRGSPASLEGGELAALVGFVLLAAAVAGTLSAEAGLPRLTGFILVGILAGPSVFRLLPVPAVVDLRLIDRFALALIAMLAGGELRMKELRPHARTIALTTLVVTGVVWGGMTVAVLAVRPLVPVLAALPWSAAIGIALLLGIWAANSSPDLTVAVIEEKRARGPLAEVILGITIAKDVTVIVLFTLTLALVRPLLTPGATLSVHVLVDLAREVGGALLIGGALGWVFSQYLGGEGTRARSPLATFLFAYVLVVVVQQLHVELLLAGVAAGFVIENLSEAGDRMIRGIRSVAVVIFAFFFAVAGASLDLASAARFWPAALLLFGARVLLTRLGTGWGTRWAGASPTVRSRSWLGLISQGGVSLGLVLVLETAAPALGEGVVALAMAIILGNILGGPILLGRALASAEGPR